MKRKILAIVPMTIPMKVGANLSIFLNFLMKLPTIPPMKGPRKIKLPGKNVTPAEVGFNRLNNQVAPTMILTRRITISCK